MTKKVNEIKKNFQTPRGFSRIGDILGRFDRDEDKYISREFQKYGYDLAEELGDLERKSLYIKLAKETPRNLLETARNFVKDAYQVKSKPRLFMWKLQQLKSEVGNKSLPNQISNIKNQKHRSKT